MIKYAIHIWLLCIQIKYFGALNDAIPIDDHFFKILIFMETMNILIFQEKPFGFLKTLVVLYSHQFQNLVMVIHYVEAVVDHSKS